MTSTPLNQSPIANCLSGAGDLLTYIQAVLDFFGGHNDYEHTMALAAWSACEGPANSQGAFNPWNTTFPYAHANGVTVTSKAGPVKLPAGNAAYLGQNPAQNNNDPVKNYADWASGVAASVTTMISLGIAPLLSAPTLDPFALASKVGSSGWGTSGSCIATTIQGYQSNPQDLCAKLKENVNSSTIIGSPDAGPLTTTESQAIGSSMDQGQAVPEGGISIGSFNLGALGNLLNGSWWQRVGLGLLGLIFIGFGGLLILSTTSVGSSTGSTRVVPVPI